MRLTNFTVGDARIEPATNTIFVGEEARHVSPKAMDVLVCLAERAGELTTTQELIDTVWQDVVVGDASLYERVAELRRNLDDHSRDPTYIETIPKRGYRLIAPVVWEDTIAPVGAAGSRDRPPTPAPSERPSTRRVTRGFWVAGTCIGLAVASAYLLSTSRNPLDEVQPDTVVIDGSRLPGVPQASAQSGADSSETNRSAPQKTRSTKAYEEYLVGTHFLHRHSDVSELERARHHLERAVELEDNFPAALAELAWAIARQAAQSGFDTGKPMGSVPSRALALAHRALQLDPKLGDAKALMATDALARGDVSAAEALFEEAGQASPDSEYTTRGLANLYAQSGRAEEAERLLRQALERDSRSTGVMLDLHLMLTRQGRHREAAAVLARAIAGSPDSITPYLMAANFQSGIGRPDEAAGTLRPLIGDRRFQAEQGRIFWHLIRSYLDLGDLEEAGILAAQAGQIAPAFAVDFRLATGTAGEELIHGVADEFPLIIQAFYESVAGHDQHAMAMFEQLHGMRRLHHGGQLGFGYFPAVHAARLIAAGGDPQRATGLLDAARSRVESRIANPGKASGGHYVLASIAAVNGNIESAITELERAVAAGWCRTWLAKLDPNLAVLRGRPDFEQLIARVDAAVPSCGGRPSAL